MAKTTNCTIKKIIKILAIVITTLFLVIGVPIIINECYKANCGCSTALDTSAMLGYYGVILGASITVATLVVTIKFTKKQIERESFLRTENEKWDKLKSVFLDILANINPMVTLKDVMDNGFVDPTKAITVLERYQVNCKTSTDVLNAYVNIDDYPKVKHLVDAIAGISEELVNISSGEVEQYSDFRLLQNKDSFYKMVEIEKVYPGSFSKESLAKNQENIEKIKTISDKNINSQIAYLNSEFIRVYKTRYIAILQNIGSTFETLNKAAAQEANKLLNIGAKIKKKIKKENTTEEDSEEDKKDGE